ELLAAPRLCNTLPAHCLGDISRGVATCTGQVRWHESAVESVSHVGRTDATIRGDGRQYSSQVRAAAAGRVPAREWLSRTLLSGARLLPVLGRLQSLDRRPVAQRRIGGVGDGCDLVAAGCRSTPWISSGVAAA